MFEINLFEICHNQYGNNIRNETLRPFHEGNSIISILKLRGVFHIVNAIKSQGVD